MRTILPCHLALVLLCGCPSTGVADADGDAYLEDDCDDADGSVHPGADELCNGIDDDCDGLLLFYGGRMKLLVEKVYRLSS